MTPQGHLYLDMLNLFFVPAKKNVLHHAKHIYFINPWLLKISAYKTLYNGSTNNPNRPKTCGLIFTPLIINLKYVN
jgi:hypothetical protein